MPYGRITVTLDLNEKSALYQLATQQRRDPREQAAFLIRQGLESLGLIEPVITTSTPQTTSKESRHERIPA